MSMTTSQKHIRTEHDINTCHPLQLIYHSPKLSDFDWWNAVSVVEHPVSAP